MGLQPTSDADSIRYSKLVAAGPLPWNGRVETMGLNLRQITPHNWRDLKIEVSEEQRNFVSPVSRILARAYVYRGDNSMALAVYLADQPIGLLMHRDYTDDLGRTLCILDQFLIDKDFQRQGYGRKALQLWLAGIRQKGKYHGVKLCYIRGALGAERLYRSLGFLRKPHDDDGDELVMEYLF